MLLVHKNQIIDIMTKLMNTMMINACYKNNNTNSNVCVCVFHGNITENLTLVSVTVLP